MCGCLSHSVCGYHTELLTDLIERLANAEAVGDDEARSLRGELASYGVRGDIVHLKLDLEAHRR